MQFKLFKKRIFACVLAVALVFPLFSFMPKAEEGTVKITTIAWNEPAIPATAGTAVDLTKFNVGISATQTLNASSVTWKNGDATITSFTPAEAGVYPLKAEGDGKAKTIYVVAKNPSDTEYVLYHNDFDDPDSISDWYPLVKNDPKIYVKESKLIIDSKGIDTRRILLPEWLGEFGNYKITALVSSSDETNTARWNSIMYRIQNNNFPYYQMAVRKDTSASNGIEFAIRTPSDAWLVPTTGSYKPAQVTGTYYTYTVKVKNNVIMHSFNNSDVVYNDDVKDYQVGRIGLHANQSIMYVDKITVSLQLDTPEFNVEPTLIETSAEVINIQNAFTNIAEITSGASFNSLDNAHTAIVYTDGTKITTPNGTAIDDLSKVFDLLGNKVIPAFYCKTKAAVDGVLELYKGKTIIDAAIISSDASIVKYARTKKTNIRGIIDFRGKYTGELTMSEISQIRYTVNANQAKTALIDASCLSRLTVDELCELLLTVWAYGDCATPEAAAAAIVLGTHGVVSPNPNNVYVAYSFFENNTLTRTPLIIGHRGNPSLTPENSMSSYKLAFENGADIVETDVYLSADNEVVIMHDGTIDRTTNGTGNIESMTLEQLKQYYCWGDNDTYKNKYPDEKIPTLRELLEYAKGKDLKVFIEIKSSKPIICKYIADLVNEYDMVDQVCVISFSLAQCKEMQRYAPAISCGFLTSITTQAGTQRMANAALNYHLPNLLSNNTTLNPSYGNTSKKLAEVAIARGVTIWPWTYTTSTAAIFTNAFMWGYGGLTTNDAQYTKNTIKNITTNLEDTILLSGKTLDYTVSSTTYGRTTADITDKAGVKILSGDSVTLNKGKLTAVKAGQTKVMFYYTTKTPNNTSYTLYTEVVTIDVLASEEYGRISLKSGSKFIDNGTLVSRVGFNTTAGDVVKQFMNTELKIVKDSKALTDTDIVGTGCVVQSLVNGQVKQSREIVVKSDLNGNGNVDMMDYIALRLMILGKGTYTPSQNAAADVDSNGAVTVTDYITIRMHLLGLLEIEP